MYRELTHGVQIDVEPAFVPEKSSEERGYYFFSYEVRITNQGPIPVQLMSRHWIITDGNGEVHEVKGDGVIGEQPLIKPGESYVYSSFCPLTTEVGNMRGSYQMVDEKGARFDARIPLFFLRNLKKFQ